MGFMFNDVSSLNMAAHPCAAQALNESSASLQYMPGSGACPAR